MIRGRLCSLPIKMVTHFHTAPQVSALRYHNSIRWSSFLYFLNRLGRSSLGRRLRLKTVFRILNPIFFVLPGLLMFCVIPQGRVFSVFRFIRSYFCIGWACVLYIQGLLYHFPILLVVYLRINHMLVLCIRRYSGY